MVEWTAAAPNTFAEVVRSLPRDVLFSERLLQPVLRIRREASGFSAGLYGRRLVGGEAVLIPAPALSFSWVLDGSTVRPLPADTPARVRDLLDGSLSFAKVVQILQLDNPLIEVQAEPSVFTPAKTESDAMDPGAAPPGLNAVLFPYQARGVRWMLDTVRHTGGVILADEMGLGKTVQIIALLLFDRPALTAPALIVCPTSLVANWRSEILRFAPDLSVMIHGGPHRAGTSAGLVRAEVVVSTYDTVVNDVAIFQGVEWSWLICDEAQAVKNPDARRRTVLASLPRRRTIPMTGTPVETSLQDLWSLTDLAIPGLLGPRNQFLTYYPDDETAARQLADITAPIVLRRRVADVAGDLPERRDIDVPLELGDELAAHYSRVLANTLARYPSAGPLVATGQLQLFCAHPWLQGGGEPDTDDDAVLCSNQTLPLMTPKLERTVALLEEAFLTGRKVLIFAIFNRCGELIREAGRHLPPAFWGAINGSTPQSDRQRIVEAFTVHAGPACLVLNPKAAGAGLNITAATIVVHYTQAWNPALEMQASARAHRRGQKDPVAIYHLFYENTVERVMIDRSNWRRDLANDAVPISAREHADLRRALTIRPEAEDG
ncbi:DEAD/DEAH box helicase [Mesorhizobium sp. M0213]|uniref:DEAD/DEAH box helicase n=1 Tax=unclassified Mesorhizobium TaxID=325217 RepID=UPI003335CAC4